MTNPLALIVEDDEDLTVIFTKALEAAGYVTEVEMDGGQAWSRLETACPALVVLDLHLPNMSGLDILHRIRANDCLVHTIVLAVSADARMAELASADADLVLIKPITFSQLRDLSSRFVPAAAESPPVAAERLPVDAERLPVDAERLPVAAERLPVDAERLPVDAESPPGGAEGPPGDAESLPGDAESSPGDQEKPSKGSPKTKAHSGQAEKTDSTT